MRSEEVIKAAAQALAYRKVPRSKRGAALYAVLRYLVFPPDKLGERVTPAEARRYITRFLSLRAKLDSLL